MAEIDFPSLEEVLARFEKASEFRVTIPRVETPAPPDPEAMIAEVTRDLPKEGDFVVPEVAGLGAEYRPEDWGSAFRDGESRPEIQPVAASEEGSVARAWTEGESSFRVEGQGEQARAVPRSPQPEPPRKPKDTQKESWDELSGWTEQ